jgi:hypothetical protein
MTPDPFFDRNAIPFRKARTHETRQEPNYCNTASLRNALNHWPAARGNLYTSAVNGGSRLQSRNRGRNARQRKQKGSVRQDRPRRPIVSTPGRARADVLDLCPAGRQEIALPLCTRENETSTGRLTLSHIGECEVANFKSSSISFFFPPALIWTLALMF